MEHSSDKWTTLNRAGGGVAMNDVLINALVARVKAGMMTIDQVPIPYQEAVRTKLEESDN